jgi:hypothetical protein
MKRRWPFLMLVWLPASCTERVDLGKENAAGALDATADTTPLLPPSCVQAASGILSGGFTLQAADDASAEGYILPPSTPSLTVPGQARALYTLALNTSGTYGLFGRIRAPSVRNNAFWMTVDTGPSILWHLSTGVIWFTGPVTSGTEYRNPIQYVLDAGPHQVLVQNADPGIALEQLCFAPAGYRPSDNDTPCRPPDSIQVADGGCQLSCGGLGGNTCVPAVCAGHAALPAYDCTVCCFAPDAGDASGEPSGD